MPENPSNAFVKSGSTLHLAFELKPEDHVAFAQYWQWDSPERRNYRLFVFFLPLLLAVFYLLDHRSQGALSWPALLFVGLCGLTMVATPYWMRYRIGWRTKRHLKANQKAGLTGEMKMELDRQHFAIEGPRGRTELRRGNLLKLVETPQHFFFFVQDQAAYLLPKAPFGEAQIEEIRSVGEYLSQG
jgi:hypothetical protein